MNYANVDPNFERVSFAANSISNIKLLKVARVSLAEWDEIQDRGPGILRSSNSYINDAIADKIKDWLKIQNMEFQNYGGLAYQYAKDFVQEHLEEIYA